MKKSEKKENTEKKVSAEKKAAKKVALKKPSFDKDKIKAFFKSRKTKRGAFAVLLTVLVIAAAIILNIVANLLTDRFPALSVDMTKSSVYQLQPETEEYLAKLDKDVTVYVLMEEAAFEAGGDYYVQANKLIKQFAQKSDKVTLKYINLSSNPTFTTPYTAIDWSSSHVLLVQSGDEYRAVDEEDMFDYNQEYLYYYGSKVIESQHVEQALVTAILNVTTEEKVKVNFITGQGEQDASAFKTLLENNAYTVEDVSLLTGKLADDAQFAVLFAPSNDLEEDAASALSEWLYNDGNYGRSFIYLPSDQVDTRELKHINALLEEWGMAVSYGYTFETDMQHMTNSQNPQLLSIFDFAETEISGELRNKSVPVVLVYTMPVEIIDESVAQPLLTTSDSAYLLPKDADENWQPDESDAGTLNGAALATKSGSGENAASSNVVVFGSYDALSQTALSATSFNNAGYMIALFNHIAQRDEIGITIEGKNLDSGTLGVTTSWILVILTILVRYIIPAAVVIAGIIVFIKRRHK